MPYSDCTGFPTKNQAHRLMFRIHDNLGQPVTAAWTSPTSQVITDGVIDGSPPTPVQIATTHFGYVDLTAAMMNGSSVCVSVAVTNVNSLDCDFVLLPIPLDPPAVVNPTTLRLTDLITQRWQYTFGKVSNDGTNIKMYDLDGTTQLAVMPITGDITKGAAF